MDTFIYVDITDRKWDWTGGKVIDTIIANTITEADKQFETIHGYDPSKAKNLVVRPYFKMED